MFTYIVHILEFPEFPGFFSFPENYLEMIRISRNSGNFLQSGNTETNSKTGFCNRGDVIYAQSRIEKQGQNHC